MQRLKADAAWDAAAVALDTYAGDDEARPDALAVYAAAAAVVVARESTPHVQVYDLVPVPDHIARFADA